MGNTFIPLLKRDTIGLVNDRASTDHFLTYQLQFSSIPIRIQGWRKGMTYRFMRYTSQSFLLLGSLVQYKSGDSENDDRDHNSNN